MKKHYQTFALVPLLTGILIASAVGQHQPKFVPKDGYVPNETTAIAIAEAVLKPIYGVTQVESERPYHAKLISGTWWVGGTLPAGRVGGVAVVRISKKDARVLSVSHGQ